MHKKGVTMGRGKFSVVSITLFVFAGLFALYTIWAASQAVKYVSDMVAANQLVIKGSEFEVANFFMSNFAQYAFFAIALFALGRIVRVVSAGSDAEEDEAAAYDEIADEDTDAADLEESEQNNAEA